VVYPDIFSEVTFEDLNLGFMHTQALGQEPSSDCYFPFMDQGFFPIQTSREPMEGFSFL